MQQLRNKASRIEKYFGILPSGHRFAIECWTMTFPVADPPKLAPGVLAKTYTDKPLVLGPRGDALFGEIAVLRWLQEDGWDGVWVDSFHSRSRRRLLWQDMPHRSSPLDPALLPAPAMAQFDSILQKRGGRIGGFFDVLAWREDRVAFFEYKGPRDSANSNERSWLDAAFASRVNENDLFYVSCRCPESLPATRIQQRKGSQEASNLPTSMACAPSVLTSNWS